ncbi:aminopeptidase N [Sphingomonas jinjuensis]|uniref:Aminopeptidase N n=1 Tax=Sphingomonas jinjuensis TaxID=535907 RepID=A0A840FDB7_9SPHN|nr:M1 family metallopeptidase [Sphingomonas jinjuensis]MBB4155599.1 aminopeptidase N [Sphingomonas jinjuensis]
MLPRLPLAAALLSLASAGQAAEKGQPPITPQTSMSGGPLDPAQKKLKFDRADLAIEVDPAREVINGNATLVFTTLERTDRVVIDLDKNYTVTMSQVNGVDVGWSNPEGRATLKLAKRVPAGTELTVKIVYGGRPHTAVRAPWDGGFVWSKTPAGQPWVATAVQMEGCDLIWPCIDYPTYEPQKVALHITVPAGLSAPSNGKLLGVDRLPDGRSTWNWEVKNPNLYGIALNVGPYEEVSGTYKSRLYGNSVPMNYWYLPGEKAQAEELFAEFAPTLDFYEHVVGPYPWADEKLGVVETPHKGMEHQTINAYGNGYAKAPEGFDWLFQHEFGHEWFANQMTAPNWDDFWLHEGFTAYMQPLYGRWREGEGRYTAMMLASRPGIQNKSALVTGKPQTAEDVYEKAPGRGGDIYSKGAWILHTLRNTIGDAAFSQVLKLTVYGRVDPAPGNFTPVFRTTPEFIAYVKQVTGKDYGWFFDVYLYQAALPKLIEKRSDDKLTLRWDAPGDKPFPLPVEVQVDDVVHKLPMTGGTASLDVPAGAHVVIDPMSRILMQSDTVDAFQAWRAAQAKTTAK